MRRKAKKQTTKKRASRKIVRKRRQKTKPIEVPTSVIDLDQFYKLANKVQIFRESVEFIVKKEDGSMIENLLKDLDLVFKRHDEKKCCLKYAVSPGPERLIEAEVAVELEDFPDEIAEDGQIFF